MHMFRSKKDWWLLAFVICMSGLLLQLLLTMQAKGTMQQYPLHTAVYVLTILILWWPLWSTRYSINKDQLIIKSLWLSWQIPLSAIQSIQPTDHSIIAPALSLKRLRIDYTDAGVQKFILVSPKDQTAFIQVLQSKKN
ncbi:MULTISPECIES: PH domain-containing protein [Acinetobacter]|uniref:PH domain-containing protein n=1 Tax=Acinetobacter TaxID=469 RepID=UPI00209A983F|nr:MULTISPECIES: PH domain-containing protein [Acinetobacter]MCO8095219.1 PH domain-containing protein [Acinetobacter lwoffii]